MGFIKIYNRDNEWFIEYEDGRVEQVDEKVAIEKKSQSKKMRSMSGFAREKSTGIIHYGKCEKVVNGNIEDFESVNYFKIYNEACPICAKAAYLRYVTVDGGFRLEKYEEFFKELELEKIRFLYEDMKAYTHFDKNTLVLIFDDEKWRIRKEGDLYTLYHNNYFFRKKERITLDKWHIQMQSTSLNRVIRRVYKHNHHLPYIIAEKQIQVDSEEQERQRLLKLCRQAIDKEECV